MNKEEEIKFVMDKVDKISDDAFSEGYMLALVDAQIAHPIKPLPPPFSLLLTQYVLRRMAHREKTGKIHGWMDAEEIIGKWNQNGSAPER